MYQIYIIMLALSYYQTCLHLSGIILRNLLMCHNVFENSFVSGNSIIRAPLTLPVIHSSVFGATSSKMFILHTCSRGVRSIYGLLLWKTYMSPKQKLWLWPLSVSTRNKRFIRRALKHILYGDPLTYWWRNQCFRGI